MRNKNFLSGRAWCGLSSLLILLLVLAGLSACSEVQDSPAMPTAETGGNFVEASATPAESVQLSSPVNTMPAVVEVPMVTPTAVPVAVTAMPEFSGAALILNPGNSSRIVSPLKPQIMVKVHPEGVIHVDLVGKGDLLYARHLLDLHKQSGQEVLLQPVLPFETQNISEPARLVVRLLDGFGRTIALTSSNLTLLSSGKSEIQPSSANGWIEIISPLDGEVAYGKKVEIIASVSPINDQPIVAELITEEKTAINTRLVKLPCRVKTG
ncbi:MAG: hypothetical protein AB9891_15335 [Anaerolineaceae bacterium]